MLIICVICLFLSFFKRIIKYLIPSHVADYPLLTGMSKPSNAALINYSKTTLRVCFSMIALHEVKNPENQAVVLACCLIKKANLVSQKIKEKNLLARFILKTSPGWNTSLLT